MSARPHRLLEKECLMTTKTGKPNGPDQPVMAVDTGDPDLDQKDPQDVMQTDKSRGDGTQSGTTAIGSDIQGHLGRKLKASYDELVRQPVPDKFRQLLEELERREKKE
jgi:Anti-sigma factor NepR